MLAAYLGAGDAPGPAGAIGLVGTAALAVGVGLRRGTPVAAGLALVGVAYGVSLVGQGLDGTASLFAGGLVLVAELAYWSIEPGAAVRVGRTATARRAAFALALAVGSSVLGGLLLAAGATPLRGDTAFGVLGVAALLLVAAIAIWLLHSLRGDAQ